MIALLATFSIVAADAAAGQDSTRSWPQQAPFDWMGWENDALVLDPLRKVTAPR